MEVNEDDSAREDDLAEAPPRLSVMGRVDLTHEGRPLGDLLRRRKPFAVLAYLALDDTGKFFQRDHLCGVFWPETHQRRARASLRQAIATIRRQLPDVFEYRGDEELRLAQGSIESDFGAFRSAVVESRWEDVEALDVGDVFEGFHLPGADGFEDWVSGLRLIQSRGRLMASQHPRDELERIDVVPQSGARNRVAPLETDPLTRRPSAARPRIPQLAIFGGIVMVAGLVLAFASRGGHAIAEREIVVSTPDYLGTDGEGVFLARGIHDEVVAQLAGIPGISLVPTSTIRQAEGTGERGKELTLGLDARYQLESSIQAEGDRVRLVFSLTDWIVAEAGETVWTEAFELSDNSRLDLRAEVASRMALALDAEPEFVTAGYAGAAPDAMRPYYTAVGLMGIEGTESDRFDRWERAEAHLYNALEIAPDFGVAWAKLAHLKFRAFWLGRDASEEGVARGQHALEQALALDPDALETRLAAAYHVYHIERDWPRAASLASALATDLANDPDVGLLWAMAERRRGQFKRSADILEAQLRRHPRELRTFGGELIGTYTRLKLWADAERVLGWIEDERGEPHCGHRYNMAMHRRGDRTELDLLVRECRVAKGFPDHGPQVFWHEFRMKRFEAALAEVDSFEALRRAAGAQRPDWLNQQWAPFPLDLWRATAARQMGDSAATYDASQRALPGLRTLAEDAPGLALRHQFLALAYAGAGMPEEALTAARAALESAVEEGDEWFGVPSAYDWLARVHAEVGNIDEAITILEEHLTGGPAPLMTVGRLRLDPTLEPLRGSPRFEALIQRLD